MRPLLRNVFAHTLIKRVFFHAMFLSSEVIDAALCFSWGGYSQGKLATLGFFSQLTSRKMKKVGSRIVALLTFITAYNETMHNCK